MSAKRTQFARLFAGILANGTPTEEILPSKIVDSVVAETIL
jgi:hypothetical protein